MENSSGKAFGLSFCQVLTLIFIVLKLTGYITWSWFWVLSPVIIPVGIVLVILIAAFILSLIANLFN